MTDSGKTMKAEKSHLNKTEIMRFSEEILDPSFEVGFVQKRNRRMTFQWRDSKDRSSVA